MSVFLCHSSKDKPAVRQLYQRLSTDGYDVWFDEERLLPGQDWNREITHAVRNADTVIICLSHSSVTKSGYYQKEIRMTLDAADEKPDGAIFLIPARFEECNIPERISRFQWVDLHKPEGYDRLIEALRFAETKKDESNRIAFDTNTKVETGIPKKKKRLLSPVENQTSSRPIQQLTVVLRSTGRPEHDRKRFKQIYGTLISFHGKDRFSFQLIENGKSHLVDFPNVTTRVSTHLLDRLKKVIGEESWRVEEVFFL